MSPTQFLDATLQQLTRAITSDMNFEDERMKANYLLTQSIKKFDHIETQVGGSRLIAMWRIYKNGVEFSGEYNEWMEFVHGELLPDLEKQPDPESRREAADRRAELLKWANVIDVIMSWLDGHTVADSNGQNIDAEAMLNHHGVSQKLRSSVKMFRDATEIQRIRIIQTIYAGTQQDISALREEIKAANGEPEQPTAPQIQGRKIINETTAKLIIIVPVADAPLLEMLLDGTVQFTTSTVE